MVKNNLPTISVLIPTLNAARVLEKCLKSIVSQNYPKNKIEIIIADGGSADRTLKIAKKYGAKIYENPLKTAESGKAVALRQVYPEGNRRARGDLVALIDSDNILPTKNWLKQMVKPFSDPEILGSEPWKFTYRKKDSLVNRYCALIGANDPYCYFVGNYDKRSILSGKWTGLNIEQEDRGSYLKVKIGQGILPTIGANGTFWRRRIFKIPSQARVKDSEPGSVVIDSYLFDTDIPYILAKKKPFYFAKVKVGIIHDYCRSIKDFYRKQKRRARDFFYLEGRKERGETYQRQLSKQLYFILSVIFVFPLIFQAIKGYLKKPDRAWFFHPLFCLITLWLYGSETILAKVKKTKLSRDGWKQ